MKVSTVVLSVLGGVLNESNEMLADGKVTVGELIEAPLNLGKALCDVMGVANKKLVGELTLGKLFDNTNSTAKMWMSDLGLWDKTVADV